MGKLPTNKELRKTLKELNARLEELGGCTPLRELELEAMFHQLSLSDGDRDELFYRLTETLSKVALEVDQRIGNQVQHSEGRDPSGSMAAPQGDHSVKSSPHQEEAPAIGPPPQVEMIAEFLLSKEQREAVLGDLKEEFETLILPTRGPAYARYWYWWKGVASIVHCVCERWRKFALVALLFKAADWLIDKFSAG